jgi:hypothetical protein
VPRSRNHITDSGQQQRTRQQDPRTSHACHPGSRPKCDAGKARLGGASVHSPRFGPRRKMVASQMEPQMKADGSDLARIRVHRRSQMVVCFCIWLSSPSFVAQSASPAT